MKINKEIVKKVIRLNKIEKEMESIRNELHEFFGNYMRGAYINDYNIVSEPSGDVQDEGEYCDQWTGYSEDSGSGVYYYQIEDSKKFVAITYDF